MVTLRRTWHVHFDTDAEELLAGVPAGMVAGPRCGPIRVGYKDRPKSDASIRAVPMAEPAAEAMARAAGRLRTG